jgi:TPP-dependent pyruvate/acetoin dehydrogenase alpha subunit
MPKKENYADRYKMMQKIRRVEETILKLFSEGKISGTTHTYTGQEANAVGIISHLNHEIDRIISNHRCHGHFLAYGGPVVQLLGEVLGKEIGACKGRGGSQHLKWKTFSSNGVLGGGVPVAIGMAMAIKRRKSKGIVTIFLGDGAMGEGTIYESLNIASLWKLPILFIIENNRIAQTTPIALNLAGSLVDRAKPFGIDVDEIESMDVDELYEWGEYQVTQVRKTRSPRWGVIHTYRFNAHSKGDDTRDPCEIEKILSYDPILLQAKRMNEQEVNLINQSIETEIEQALLEIEDSKVAGNIL